ncbi:MAG: hypothetical protein V3R85_00125 [Alphaproteobacteria bacterium]
MSAFKNVSILAAMAVATGLFASPALADGPPPAEPIMTPAAPTGVRVVLPSGRVVILPVEPDIPMPGANRDQVVGEELC